MNGHAGRRIVVIVPWLQGGGAQAALRETMRHLQAPQAVLVVLFGDVRNSSSLEAEFDEVHHVEAPKTLAGVWSAGRWLRNYLDSGDVVFSLMRGSHVVLGLLPDSQLRMLHLLASFHQLPSVDAAGRASKLENVLVRRAMKHAELITAPSNRAIDELHERNLIPAEAGVMSPNLIARDERPLVPPRTGRLTELRLLIAGRLDRQKGIDRIETLLEGSPVPVHLTVAGDGPLRAEVERLVDTGSVRVHYLGHVSDIFSVIDSVDFLFLPSRYELNPVIVWEGWERHRIALAADIPAFRDLASVGPVRLFQDRDSLHALMTEVASAHNCDRNGTLKLPTLSGEGNPLLAKLQGLIVND